MIDKKVDLAIIGGGPSGLATAIAAKQEGISDLLIIERSDTLGGILGQCIHDGFGLEIYKESLTGPEYMEKDIELVKELDIECMLNSMVTKLTPTKELVVVNQTGVHKLHAKAVVLAMGCRERTRGALGIPGTRPAGIYTAGATQYFVNIKNYLVGSKVVIVGSGDIGLIMARRMTLEGGKVMAVVEKLPYPSGLPRNIVQCLEDYNIPLMLSHTVTKIKGRKRVNGVTIMRVDHNFAPISRTEVDIDCDALVLSVGLIPENELSKLAGIRLDQHTGGPIVDDHLQTSVEGIFAAGNVLHVHDIVDWVSMESTLAGKNAAQYIKGENGKKTTGKAAKTILIRPGVGVNYVLPQMISANHSEKSTLFLRVTEPAENVYISIIQNGQCLKRYKQRKVHHAVMIRLDIDKKDILSDDELLVEIQEK